MTEQLNMHAHTEYYIFHDKIENTFDPQFHSVISKKDNTLFEFTERERGSLFLWIQLLFCWN